MSQSERRRKPLFNCVPKLAQGVSAVNIKSWLEESENKYMTTVNIRRWSDADTLKEFTPDTLLDVLKEDAEFLATKGVSLPARINGVGLDYEALAKVFLSPEDIPAGLVEKFHLIGEMSGQNAMDRIVDVVRARQLPLKFPQDATPRDVAAQLLLENKSLFQELHAEQAVEKYRSFIYFVTDKKAPEFKPPADLTALEEELNRWYDEHRRGRSARVFWRQKDNEFWFYVRHAEPVKRDGSVGMKDNLSGSTIYRPERHDLVVYDAEVGEMRVHADAKNEPELFRGAFGQHLFKDRNFFPMGRAKYTLEPLRTKQRAALACGGIEGLLSVTLTEVELYRPGALWERETHSAADIFSVFEAREFVIPGSYEIRKAKFAVRFADNKRPRMVTIRPTNYILYGRDDDAAMVEKWLSAQDFIVKEEPPIEDEEGTLE